MSEKMRAEQAVSTMVAETESETETEAGAEAEAGAGAEAEAEAGDDHSVVVGVVADPGLSAEVAERLADDLPDALGEQVSDRVRWQVRVTTEAAPLDEHGEIDLAKHARERMAQEGWDLMICLTDLPRLAGTTPIIGDVTAAHDAALVSLPAMGWLPLRRNVRDTVVRLVEEMTTQTVKADHAPDSDRPLQRRSMVMLSPIRRVPSAVEGVSIHLILSGGRGRARLLFGMVRTNRPWRLVPGLSSAIAAAAGVAAFGIFFSNVWSLADALSIRRLALVNVVAVAAMIAWLIVYNDLWARPARRAARQQALLYNASTVVTLTLGVACMYLVLFAITLAGALAVISADYLASTLGHPVGWVDYLSLVWLSSSMGTVAGALGSGLESEKAVRRATYSQREQERQDRRREQENRQDAAELMTSR